MKNNGNFVCAVCKLSKPSYKAYKGSSPKVCKVCVQTALKSPYTAHQNRRYCNVRGSAEIRGIPFLLTKDQFIALGEFPCHYCGDANNNYGIDRFDNSGGYTVENSRSCCSICNIAKHVLAAKDYIEHCTKVVNFNKNK